MTTDSVHIALRSYSPDSQSHGRDILDPRAGCSFEGANGNAAVGVVQVVCVCTQSQPEINTMYGMDIQTKCCGVLRLDRSGCCMLIRVRRERPAERL